MNKLLKLIGKLTEQEQVEFGSALACSNEFQHIKVSTENARVFNAMTKQTIETTKSENKTIKAKNLREINAAAVKKANESKITPIKSHEGNIGKMGHLGELMSDAAEVTSIDEFYDSISH